MNHQPFETWILDDIQITPEEKASLDQHLKECPECFELHRSWQKIETELRAAPVKVAPQSFVPKWKTDFALRKKEQERRQARTLLISLISCAVAVLIVLGAILLPDFSLISLMVGFISTIVKIFSSLQDYLALFRSIFESAPPSIIIITGLLIAGWISLAVFTWSVSVWRLTRKEVKVNE